MYSLLLTLAATFLIPNLKSKVNAVKLDEIMTWVQVAVEAAEMIYVGTGNCSLFLLLQPYEMC